MWCWGYRYLEDLNANDWLCAVPIDLGIRALMDLSHIWMAHWIISTRNALILSWRVTVPPRKINCAVNLIFSNNSHRIVQCDVLHSSISDHSIVFCTFKRGVRKLPPMQGDWVSLFQKLQQGSVLAWLEHYTMVRNWRCQGCWWRMYLWDGLFRGVADEHAPLKTKRVKGKQSPWTTAKLLEYAVIVITIGKKLMLLVPITIEKCTGNWGIVLIVRRKSLNQNIIIGWLKMPRETAPRCEKQLKRRFHLIAMELMQFIPSEARVIITTLML